MRRFWYLFRAACWLTRVFGAAAWHFRKHGLQALALSKAQAMTADEIRRFEHYYYGTTYLAALMGALRNKALSIQEKEIFTQLSALAASFDDLVDSFGLPDDALEVWQNNPEDYGRLADPSGKALHWLQMVDESLQTTQRKAFRAYVRRVFNVEMAAKQLRLNPSDAPSALDALLKIAAEKGGASVLLFRSVLDNPPSNAEENAFFQCGCLLQLSDDIFDLWHDRQAGAHTVATWFAERADIQGLMQCFERQVSSTVHSIRQTAYPAQPMETTLYVLHFLTSITRVCLEHYQSLAQRYPVLPLDNRNQMVVDMDLLRHRTRTAWQLLHPLEQIFFEEKFVLKQDV